MHHKKIVAIHQPNFFPWLGYFNKIMRADAFIFLDNTQFSKTGGTWSNRVQLVINSQPAWITMPIVRNYHGVRLIADMEINDAIPWRIKFLKTLQINYRRAHYFQEIYPFLEDLIYYNTDKLSLFNINTIIKLAQKFHFDKEKFIIGSSLSTEGKATELLISLIKSINGSSYLCGGGASEYQEDGKFAQVGMELIYQNFNHPVYDQVNSKQFIPGLSIIDALMNCGFSRTVDLIS